VIKIAKLSDSWFNAFGGCFEDEEDIIEFIFERLNTSDFQDRYIDCGGYGEPNEKVKQTAEDKRELLYDFMMSLVNKE
jgi:HEPN domain-containing protein